jgi:hypothetical protein
LPARSSSFGAFADCTKSVINSPNNVLS